MSTLLVNKVMLSSKFVQFTKHPWRKTSIVYAILISFIFVIISVINHQGGVLHPEMDVRLPFYMSDTPLLNKIFDSDLLELGFYRARELSYLFDFVDSKFIEFSIENGFPHFLSLTHYLFSIAIGCLLWLFCVKELKLSALMGIGWLALFWTSPSIFLGGSFFRAGKIVVAFLTAILIYVIYKVAQISKNSSNLQISKKVWFLYSISIFLITFLDEQGLFFAFTVLVFLTIWNLYVRDKNIYMMLFIGVAGIFTHGIYRYIIAPRLTFMLNRYWPDFSYIPTMPFQHFIDNLGSYLSAGVFLYVETLRFLIGNPPLIVAYGFLALFIIVPVIYLYNTPGLSGEYKKFFILALVGLLIINICLAMMNALMVLKKPDLLSLPDIKLAYYFVSINVILAMTLAMLTDIFFKLRIPKWLVLMIMCFAIAGNINALPKHKSMMKQGHIHRSYQYSLAILNALKNLDSIYGLDKRLIYNSNLLAFFQSQKNKLSINVKDYSTKGIYYARRGQYRKAIEIFNKAIIYNPNDIQSYKNRGDIYCVFRQHQLAIEDYNKIIRLMPDNTDSYYNRGWAYTKLGQYQRAIEDFNKAILLKPNYAMAYYNRGNAYSIFGQDQLAIEDYNQAIRLRPTATAYNNRAGVHFRQGNNAYGCKDVEKACEMGGCMGLEWAREKAICQ